ncbi:hypothetical protein KP509_02G107200 [Ceratopteris richardii]|uniref:beta-ketoacyl-[acyl-carrier-protein] synthase III n=1 Tax=Ceratopteris richardii TaxID=49495 RepID=A0A8T2VCM6_CERRI|nr:hypothetical protein KP509_02G107200 [Ceratopteris richardii]
MAIVFTSPSHLQPSSSSSLSLNFASSSKSLSSAASCSQIVRLCESSIVFRAYAPTCKSVLVNCSGAEAVEDQAKLSTSNRALRRTVGKGSKLIGCGSATPKLSISNEYLSKFVDTSDEWISVRTGIRNRKILSDGETVTDLAVKSSKKALEMANLKAEEIDLVLLCTSTPDDLFGSAAQVQRELGCNRALAFDITAACSGFVLGLVTGGGFENVLVVGADALSRYVDWTDRGTCILFGDGAGAVILQATSDEQDCLLGFDFHSDGNGQRHLHALVRSTDKKPGDEGAVSNGDVFLPSRASVSCIQMNGKEVFRFAVRCVPETIQTALEEAGLHGPDLDWLLLHQANQRILDAVAERLQIPPERVISNLSNYGNTSAASIPLALDEAVRCGKVKPGDVLATAGFGAGLTWGSAIVRWA